MQINLKYVLDGKKTITSIKKKQTNKPYMETPRQKKRADFNLLKLLEWIASLLFAAVIAILIAGFFPLSHPLISKYARSIINKSTLDTCNVGKIKLALWKGVTMYDIHASESAGNGLKYELELSRIRINFNVINAMQKWSQIKKRYQLFCSSFSQDTNNDISASVDRLLRFAAQTEQINSICIDGKTVRILKGETPFISAERFSLDIFREHEKSQNIELDLDVAELVYLNNDFTFIRANGLFNNKILDISRCRARVFDGKVKINTRLDLTGKRIHEFILNGSGLNIDKMIRSGIMQRCISGKMDIDLNLASSSLELDSVRGKGVIRLSGVSVWETPVQKALVELLKNPEFSRLSFSRVKADFDLLDRNTVRVNISGSGEMLDFKSNGMLTLNGEINQQVDAALSEAAVKELPNFLVNSLAINENNRSAVRCRIYGTLGEPKVELDREILKKAIGGVFEQMRENLKDFFRKN